MENALELRPGQYGIRRVNRDRVTGQIGSVTAPLTVDWKLPTAPSGLFPRLARSQNGAAGKHIRNKLAFVDHHPSSHYQIADAHAWLHRLFEGGAVGDRSCVEDDDVSVSAFLHSSLLSSCRCRPFEHLGRH